MRLSTFSALLAVSFAGSIARPLALCSFVSLSLCSACQTVAPVDIGLADATREAMSADEAVPVDAFVVDTAQQEMPQDIVLEGADPGTPHVLSYPSFVLRWPANENYAERLVLIDAGFDEDTALEFGAALQQLVWAAKPMEFKTSLADGLKGDADKVELVLFTHMHHDHIIGLKTLCDNGDGDDGGSSSKNAPGKSPRRIIGFLSESQAELAGENANTEKGLIALREMSCVDSIRAEYEDGKFTAVDDKRFPGLYVMRTAGHTPGTQVVLARTTQGWMLFIGDVVNAEGGYDADAEFGHPKPFLYRAVLVPEDEGVLQGARKDLRDLMNELTIIISHDAANISASELKPYANAGAQTSAHEDAPVTH
ncbi:MAG: MBL fold metallo-hydrolase [Deltaproteobacteria bacterium]|nr:MBL fold metallo-hydrolase [Deltaproteobacteria bacterium]